MMEDRNREKERRHLRRLAEVRRVRFDHRKACSRLAKCILTTVKLFGGLQRFGEYVLTNAKRVVGLQKFGECVFTTAKHLGGFQSFEESVLTS